MVGPDLCTGCMSCAAVCKYDAIHTDRNMDGFLEPQPDTEKCVHCGMCEAVCSINTEQDKDCDISHIKTYVFKAERQLRDKSQSGGAFGIVGEYIIKHGGVVYGAYLDENLYCRYKRAETIADLDSLKKSKYVQADIGGGAIQQRIAEDLRSGRRVLFSGTPCYVDGVLRYIKCLRINTNNLILADIVCHGTPSPKVFSDYLAYYSESHNNAAITSFNFRDKKFGWYGHVTIGMGKKTMVNDDYSKIFYSKYTQRNCCYSCRYASLNRVGDITFGDAWGIEKTMPEVDDGGGVSLVIVNSDKGAELWQNAQAGRVNQVNIEVSIADFLQPNLQRPTPKPKDREKFWEEYRAKGFSHAVNHYCIKDGGFNEYELLTKKQYIGRIKRKLKKLLKL